MGVLPRCLWGPGVGGVKGVEGSRGHWGCRGGQFKGWC